MITDISSIQFNFSIEVNIIIYICTMKPEAPKYMWLENHALIPWVQYSNGIHQHSWYNDMNEK